MMNSRRMNMLAADDYNSARHAHHNHHPLNSAALYTVLDRATESVPARFAADAVPSFYISPLVDSTETPLWVDTHDMVHAAATMLVISAVAADVAKVYLV